MRGKLWDPVLVWSLWVFVGDSSGTEVSNGTREWANWREGYISDKRPSRTVRCAGCGEKLTPEDVVLYGFDCASGPGAGWTGSGRWVHREPCIGTEEALAQLRTQLERERRLAEETGRRCVRCPSLERFITNLEVRG